MRIIHRGLPLAILLSATSLAIGGCVTPTKQVAQIHPQFQPADIRSIAVLPVLDGRVDKTVEIDIDDAVHSRVAKRLSRKDYQASVIVDRGLLGPIDHDIISRSDPGWIRALPPTDARWVMLLVLEDLTRKLTFGSTANAEISAYLFDKENGTVAWRAKGIGQAGQGGLIGMAFIGLMADSAIELAVKDMMERFPRKPKKQ